MEKLYCIICGKYGQFKIIKYHTFFKNHQFFFLICSESEIEDEKIFEEEDSIEILKILHLTENI